jgi:hypothetical protein
MTSAERKEARYQRRKAKREQRRRALLETFNFDRVCSPDSLYKAAKKARSGVYWKASVQRYNMNLLRNVLKASKDLKTGVDIRKGFIEFNIIERGKKRRIRSVHFSERVIQRSICENALIPLLTRGLTYDNGASIKNKGIDFALRRLKAHLARHYRHHGKTGYVLTVDFKSYFDNIRHEPISEYNRRIFGEDERLYHLAMLFVYAFGAKGLGLGSETSQINAIAYPNSIDHYIKEVLRCKYYGRYMDDSYIICESKEQARSILAAILAKYAEMGIIVNQRKTAIIKLSRGFTFLKTHFSLSDTGAIIDRPCRESAARQRRKLKKFVKFLAAGVMTLGEIRGSYMSWRGYIGHKRAGRTIRNMDLLYKNLFGLWPTAKF